MSNKRGPWTKEETDYIEAHSSLKPEEIASHIQRNVDSVKKYMEENGLLSTKKVSSKTKLEYDIRDTPHWINISKQFDEDERELFLYHWNNTIKQFNEDIFHTEETQIIDMIKIEIMMNRELNKQRRIVKQIERLEEELDDESLEKDARFNKERQVAGLYTAMETLDKSYREWLKQKNDILNKLKATREQRIKDVESSKESILGWFRDLHHNTEKRKRMGLNMEKLRLAKDVEFERLSDFHKYDDGVLDQPFLTPDSVKE